MKKMLFSSLVFFIIILIFLALHPYEELTIDKTMDGIFFTLDGNFIKKDIIKISGIVKQYRLGSISFNGKIEFDSYTISCSERIMNKTHLSKLFNSYEVSYESYHISPFDNFLYANNLLISTDFNSIYLFNIFKTNHNRFHEYKNTSPLCLYATNKGNIKSDATKELIKKYILSKQ